ncbi:MAG: 2-oxo-4-hydroxy-4-carboxy-5-ureidoimidazoline decarboxylase [Cyanobacteria bacterium P01_D01_bin.156]
MNRFNVLHYGKPMDVSINHINQLDQSAFVDLLGGIFEDTPSIAAQVWGQRPFQDLFDLHTKMVAIVEQMTTVEKLALIKAHPELGSRRPMADASVKEQASAGLDRINQSVYDRLVQLNGDYRQKFGFPFVMAVKGQTQEAILGALETRMANAQDDEVQQALVEIYKIARLRLEALVVKPPEK